MGFSLSHPVAILNFIEWILNIVVAGLVGKGTWLCVEDAHKFQFMSAVVYGFLIVTSILIISLFAGEVSKIPRIVLAAVGAFLWLCTGAFLLEGTTVDHCSGELYKKVLAAGVISIIMCVTQVLDSIFSSRMEYEEMSPN